MQDFWNAAKVYLDFFQWAFTGIVSFALWRVKRDKSQDTQVKYLRDFFTDKLAEHEIKFAHIEEQLKHVPSSTETAMLTERINSLDKSLTTLNLNIGRVNEFLLNSR